MRNWGDSKSMQPLVSIIMPSYNAEKYIAKAIESVMAQTYTNWELLVFDDGSTDHTAEIALSFEAADSRIFFYRNPQNLGVAKTRNRGIELAKGEWVALLDSDDVWHHEKLQKQLEKAAETGAQILYTSYEVFSEYPDSKTDYIVPSSVDYDSMLIENKIGCSTVLVKRSVLDRHRFQGEIYHEDYALWLELLKEGYTAAGCSEVLTYWRLSKSSRSFNKLSAAKNRWIIYRRVEKLSIWKSLRLFAAYAYHGISKYKRV